jgi:hypothetical protein
MLHSIYSPQAISDNKKRPIQIVDVLSTDVEGNRRDAITTSAFSALNYKYTGIDIEANYNVDLVMGIAELPMKLGGDVDIVVTAHHFENNAVRASYAMEILKLNGLMMVVIPPDDASYWRITDETAHQWASETNDRFLRAAQARSRAAKGGAAQPAHAMRVMYSASVPGGELVMVFLKCESHLLATHGAHLKKFLDQVGLLSLVNLYRYQVAAGIPVPPAFIDAYQASGIASATIPSVLLVPDPLLAEVNGRYLTVALCRHSHPTTLPAEYLELAHVKVPIEMVVRNPQGNCTVALELLLRERDFFYETDCQDTVHSITEQLRLRPGNQLYADIVDFVMNYVKANKGNINFYKSMANKEEDVPAVKTDL